MSLMEETITFFKKPTSTINLISFNEMDNKIILAKDPRVAMEGALLGQCKLEGGRQLGQKPSSSGTSQLFPS